MRRYRLFRRGTTYYAHDAKTKKQLSLQTKNRREAERLLIAKNEAVEYPQINLGVAKAHLLAHDPKMVQRTWKEVMAELVRHGRPSSRDRSSRAVAAKPFDLIRDKTLIQTTSEDFLLVLNAGGTATNNYLRRLHNLGLGLGWLPWPILAPKVWPKITYKLRRGITWDEHHKIVSTEVSEERRLFYEVLWETGGSQSDIACLKADDIDWPNSILAFHRKKLAVDAEPCILRIGERLEGFLRQLPQRGPLFPTWSQILDKYRSCEFQRRCKLLKIQGVSLHSYRYAWAERAKECGYPERFAQAALGHKSKAVHRAYAKAARVIVPSLEDYAKKRADQKIIPIAFQHAQAGNSQ